MSQRLATVGMLIERLLLLGEILYFCRTTMAEISSFCFRSLAVGFQGNCVLSAADAGFKPRNRESVSRRANYFSVSYSRFASCKIGRSGSASFQSARKF